MTFPVAIIDYDCISPLGRSLEDTWARAASNCSGVDWIRRFHAADSELQGLSQVSYAAQVPIDYVEMAGSQAMLDKWPEPGHHAVRILVRRLFSRLKFDITDHDSNRIGILGATVLTSHVSTDRLQQSHRTHSNFILSQCHNIPVAAAAAEYGLQGPSFAISGACASSSYALYTATQYLRLGIVDIVLCLGYEFPVVPCCVAGMKWINALYSRIDPGDRAYDDPKSASRPFSRDRSGLVLGEGAAAVILANPSYAEKMAWPAKGYLRGCYANSDAGHLTRSLVPNLARCMRGALEDAGCVEADVQCVNTHATSTVLGDKAELLSLQEVFAPRLTEIPLVANKSQIGHSLGAASMLSFVLCVEGMRKGVVLPTLNYLRDADLPEARLSSTSFECAHQLSIINSFGFGGTNVCLVVTA